jgi:hypothetical protein
MKVNINDRKGRKHIHLFEQGKSLPSMGVITSTNTPILAILMWVKEKIDVNSSDSNKLI